jgi:AraC family transcriptional regulator of adaptative response / DNA-3-methyladenine glycosylase II
MRLIAEGALDGAGVDALAARLGVTARHLRRLLVQHLGAAPLTRRTDTRAPAVAGCYRFRLTYRPPYDWDATLGFLAARATPGVESVEDQHYRRTITVDGEHGTIDVSRISSGPALALEIRFPDPRALLVIVERVRQIFDLAADPVLIAEHLRADPLLRGLLARHPGIRTPGAWDGFELAVRAILGQQISVRGATTIAGRIAATFGSSLANDGRLFPTPAQLAGAPLERAGVMPSRAETIRELARRVTGGAPLLTALQNVPGIGPWTREYIAMRALNEPDAFPSGDLILRRMAGNCTVRELDRRSQSWRPWRAYAVMLLWQEANRASAVLVG